MSKVKIDLSFCIKIEGRREDVEHMPTNLTRVLVGVPINLSHQLTQIEEIYSSKIDNYRVKLK